MSKPLVSVVISCLNGAPWLPNCFAALRKQTIFEKIEVILVDDFSTDGTAEIGRRELPSFPRWTVLQNTAPMGYTGGNNRGAAAATGEWVMILNDDTQLEPAGLEKMIRAMETSKSDASSSQVASLTDSGKTVPQPLYFDIFGRPSWKEEDADLAKREPWVKCFMFGGPGFMVRREVWNKIGGFDPKHFMYAEDDDISWKLWLAGYQAVHVRTAILHHRNPMEDGSWEISTYTRYLVNRNSLLVIAKNGQNLLLLCLLLQMMMLAVESVFFLGLTRDWKFVKKSYVMAVVDFFKMWPHIREQREFIRSIRRRSDWEMIRLFLTIRVNRWDMIKAFFLKGIKPKVKQTKTTT
jgi:GT2 family glycosyltransferase